MVCKNIKHKRCLFTEESNAYFFNQYDIIPVSILKEFDELDAVKPILKQGDHDDAREITAV